MITVSVNYELILKRVGDLLIEQAQRILELTPAGQRDLAAVRLTYWKDAAEVFKEPFFLAAVKAAVKTAAVTVKDQP